MAEILTTKESCERSAFNAQMSTIDYMANHIDALQQTLDACREALEVRGREISEWRRFVKSLGGAGHLHGYSDTTDAHPVARLAAAQAAAKGEGEGNQQDTHRPNVEKS